MKTMLFSAAGIVLAAALCPRVLAEPPAADPPAAEEPPPVTIVKGGGLAEVYRAEGAGYAAYGPDHRAPARPSEPVQGPVLRALDAARDIELVALDAGPGAVADLSCGSACVGGYPVRMRLRLDRTASDGARRILRSWVGAAAAATPVAAPGSACQPAFRHAVKFSHDGYRYEVLLAADCGRYRMLRGGVPVAEADAAERASLEAFDDLLADAGR